MATIKNLSALATLLVVAVALLPRTTVGNPNCAKGMTADCGSSLFQIIILADTFEPTNECCRELVKAGKKCHNQFVELILSKHKGIRGTISDVHRRSNETWNNCVAATKSVSPPEPAH
ncbi:Prolamin_like domain-containing protein [Psidium guajava]|nr:Prolamin_like domain-containing protein [Psidium guajava]